MVGDSGMRKQRKEDLMYLFPAVPYEYMKLMQDTPGPRNYCIFLTNGKELFARCFHRYKKGREIIERQRYVFAKDGYVRYGLKFDTYGKTHWEILTEFREPVFHSTCYACAYRPFDNSYNVLNFNAVENSDMKYSQLSKADELPISYLRLYIKHKNLEYLVKAGYSGLITEEHSGGWSCVYTPTLKIHADIDWKSNNLLKMLHLNRTEFKTLKDNERYYKDFILWRKEYPKYKPQDLLLLSKVFGSSIGTVGHLMHISKMSIRRTARYLFESGVPLRDYTDYLEQCKKLEYNLKDTAVCFPDNFYDMHTRCTSIIKYKADKKKNQEFASRLAERQKFEFEYNDLILIQPASMEDIIKEGQQLEHCVGGYAERHALGSTNIFFIRQRSAAHIPYYTVEVSNDYRIIQCRGYRNDSRREKPDEIKEFEKQYQKYLEGLKNGNNRIDKTA